MLERMWVKVYFGPLAIVDSYRRHLQNFDTDNELPEIGLLGGCIVT